MVGCADGMRRDNEIIQVNALKSLVDLLVRQESQARLRVEKECHASCEEFKNMQSQATRIALKAEMMRAIGGAYRPASAPARGSIRMVPLPPSASPSRTASLPEHDEQQLTADDLETIQRRLHFESLLRKDAEESAKAKQLAAAERDCNRGVVGRLRSLKRTVKSS